MSLIPKEISLHHKRKEKDFTRERKLPFPKLIVFILFITVSGKGKGVDSKSGEFFRNARRSGLWPSAQAAHRGSISKGRNKISWEVFKELFYDAVKLAYELWPQEMAALPSRNQRSKYLWQGISVFAIDGSRYTLPATEQIREEFDPKSGFEYKGKGHYPQCLVSTAYDVFRRLPIARTIVNANASEREQVKELLPHIPPNNLLLFDRGYPSYELIHYLSKNYSGHYLFRCRISETFSVVKKFLESNQEDGIIEIVPTNKSKARFSEHERKNLRPIKLRVIRMTSPDGTLSVLLTNLMNKIEIRRESIIDLYFRRWEVEVYYRDEKIYLEVEKFHSKNCNGIRQELFAAVTMSVIARILMVVSSRNGDSQDAQDAQDSQDSQDSRGVDQAEPQFKNAVMTIAAEAVVLTPENPQKAIAIFREILDEIRRVKYYRPKTPKPPKPRVTKRAKNKWLRKRDGKMNNP